ncbi:MAG: ThiF family adenylyltransferase [Anaerolineae bacterium]|nr:ThiF family adenylyltransferase [Anaerolineae bacterium]
MDTLTIEPTYRVVLGDVNRFRIMVVGAGGTGSTLALFLAGLAFHARQKGIQVELTLVDHDVVEMKNCGRQAVSLQAAQVGGIPKVADLALRLNAAYGLGIEAWPVKYEAGLARGWYHRDTNGSALARLIIGCVDNHLGRQEIARTITAFDGRIWAIDSGNEQHSGQVLIGNLTDVSRIRLDRLGLCRGLPSPYVQEPDLLEPDPAAHSQSCAELTLAEAQSLMVNRMAAAIAAQYVATFVLQRQVLQLGSTFNLDPPTIRSRLITATAISQYHQ